MSATEQQVRIAAQLYDVRDTVRRFLGPEYAERMRGYETVIRAVAEQRGIALLAAAQVIVQEADLESFAAVFVLAAAVELVEPTP